jgi:hypothetical protein
MTSGISTFFESLLLISAGVGLLLSAPKVWAAAAAFKACALAPVRLKLLLFIEMGVAA